MGEEALCGKAVSNPRAHQPFRFMLATGSRSLTSERPRARARDSADLSVSVRLPRTNRLMSDGSSWVG